MKLDWRKLFDEDEDLTATGPAGRGPARTRADRYGEREAEIDGIVGEGAMRDLERRVMLSVLDRKWREHLYEMDYLKEGIGLRAMAQRDPLVEYQREGFDMFNGMLDALKEESVGFLFNLQVEPAPAPDQSAQPSVSDVPAARRFHQRQRQRPGPGPCTPEGPPGAARRHPNRLRWTATCRPRCAARDWALRPTANSA